MSLVRMHPADVAASMDAPNKFAQRTNRGLADATCNLVTGVMLPLEPNGYSSCTRGTRTVLFGNSPRGTRQTRARARRAGIADSPYFIGFDRAEARFAETAILPR